MRPTAPKAEAKTSIDAACGPDSSNALEAKNRGPAGHRSAPLEDVEAFVPGKELYACPVIRQKTRRAPDTSIRRIRTAARFRGGTIKDQASLYVDYEP